MYFLLLTTEKKQEYIKIDDVDFDSQAYNKAISIIGKKRYKEILLIKGDIIAKSKEIGVEDIEWSK